MLEQARQRCRFPCYLGASLLLAALACRPAATPPRPLVIGAPPLSTLGLLDIAAGRGEFTRQGVRVERRSYPSGRDALDALLRGEVDLAACYDTPLVLAVLERADVRVLTSLHHASAGTVVLARADRGITRAEDLRGRRVGVPRATSAAFFLDTVLAFAGVPSEAVTQVEVTPEGAPSALARGEVDAVAVWYPVARRVRAALPARAVVELTSEVHTELSMLVARPGLVSARRAEVTGALRALSAAERLTVEHPDQAFAALRAAHPSEPEDELREDWARVRPELGLRNAMLAVLEREARWILNERGRPGPGPDFRELFAQEPLAAADPEAVTVHPALPPPVEEGESP